MSKSIADRIEELALLTVMLHAGDTQGIDVIRTLLQELQACAKQEDGFAPLIEACESVLAQKTDEPERVIETINKFISGAQAFLGDPSKTFDVGAKDLQWGDDLSTHADPELIVEFIEKHTTMLDDLEAAIMQIANADQPEEHELAEFQGYVKSYLHNIKGDAGSVGLQGIERVTHSLEDRLLEISAHKFLDQLLLYREWVIQVMNAYTQGHTPTELSHDVLPKLADNKDNALVDSVEQKPAAQETQQKAFVSRSYTIGGDVEILSEFLIEAEEHLGSIETLLLEKEEGFDKEDLDTIFRAMHSIKGGSSYFNLQDITTTSHAAENLMDKARNGQLLFNTALKSIVLRYIDMQRSLLDAARTAVTKDGLLHTLPEVSDFLEIIADYLEAIRMIEQIDFLESSASQIQEEQGLEESGDASVVESAPKVDLADNSSKSSAPIHKMEVASPASGDLPKSPPASGKKAEVKSFVKIETRRLDHLLEYIGEMVISSSMLIKNCRDLLGDNEAVANNSNQLERISREIQEIGMSMRLIEIKGLFQKMSRVVWDTAKKLKKDIRFDMHGEETELDRTVIDKLADPLMHMVRNAVDHGIEEPSVRQANGKTAQGTVTLSAYQAGGSIFIQISDDGKGLDPQKLIELAIEKGVLEEGTKLTDEEAYMLIFAPGFSTAKVVTDVSGRGVGMDVVKRNIESMRGRVSIQSEIGKGSTFTIQLPLTLAIMDGIETAIGDERFIVPSLSIVEFLKPAPDMIMHTLDRGETLQFRGMFLPIFRLADLYQIETTAQHPSEAILVIVESGDDLVALMVDEVLGKFSAVIKSLGSAFREVEGISGCAIMPNGSIGLILDVPTLVSLGQNLSHTFSKKRARLPSNPAALPDLPRGAMLH